jgi:hypothetical protein
MVEDFSPPYMGAWLGLLATTPSALAFSLVRASEIFVYPLVAWLAKMPSYCQAEWVNFPGTNITDLSVVLVLRRDDWSLVPR